MALETLGNGDLTRVATVSVEEKMLRETTITMARALHQKFKKLAANLDSSMNIVVNTALAYWLAKQGEFRLGWRAGLPQLDASQHYGRGSNRLYPHVHLAWMCPIMTGDSKRRPFN